MEILCLYQICFGGIILVMVYILPTDLIKLAKTNNYHRKIVIWTFELEVFSYCWYWYIYGDMANVLLIMKEHVTQCCSMAQWCVLQWLISHTHTHNTTVCRICLLLVLEFVDRKENVEYHSLILYAAKDQLLCLIGSWSQRLACNASISLQTNRTWRQEFNASCDLLFNQLREHYTTPLESRVIHSGACKLHNLSTVTV